MGSIPLIFNPLSAPPEGQGCVTRVHSEGQGWLLVCNCFEVISVTHLQLWVEPRLGITRSVLMPAALQHSYTSSHCHFTTTVHYLVPSVSIVVAQTSRNLIWLTNFPSNSLHQCNITALVSWILALFCVILCPVLFNSVITWLFMSLSPTQTVVCVHRAAA